MTAFDRMRAALLAASLAAVPSDVPAGGFGANVRVNTLDVMTLRQERTALAARGASTVYAVWYDYRGGRWDLFLAKSTDGGRTFGPNRFIDTTAAPREEPGSAAVAVDASGTIYIAWSGYHAGNWDVYLTRSQDGGASFGPRVRVDDSGAAPVDQRRPALALDAAGNPVVAWEDRRGGDWDIYVARSLDGGASFGPGVPVDHTGAGTADQTEPALRFDGAGRLHVVWQDGRSGDLDVYASRSLDGGQSFRQNVRVDDAGGGSGDQARPSVAVDAAGTVFVAWQDEREDPDADRWRIALARSINGGASFASSRIVPDATGSRDQTRPTLALHTSGALLVAYAANSFGSSSLVLVRSLDGGTSFGAAAVLGAIVEPDAPAAVAIGSTGVVNVAWNQDRDVACRRSTNGGASFAAIVRVNDNLEELGLTTRQINPALVLGPGGTIYVAWAESPRLVQSPIWEIFLARSVDGGRTFGPQVRVNSVTTPSGVFFPSPALAVDGAGRLFVAWEDFRRGTWDIFVARSDDGGLSFGPNVLVNDAPSDPDFDNGGPALAMGPAGELYTAWTDGRGGFSSGWNIRVARSDNGGTSFRPSVRADDGPGASDQVAPALAADPEGHLYLAWQDNREGDQDVFFSKSTNKGGSWSAGLRVNQAELPEDRIDQLGPALALGPGGRVFVAWSDNREGVLQEHIHVARSLDAGTSFRRSVRADRAVGDVLELRLPAIAADAAGNLVVTWQDGRDFSQNDLDIYAARSPDGGISFQPDTRVDDSGATRSVQDSPAVALDAAGNTLVAWTDSRNLDNQDIYFAAGMDGPPQPTPTPTATATPTATPTPLAPGDLSFLGPWQVTAGAELRVPVVFHAAATPLGGYVLDLAFDAALLELTDVEGGDGEFGATPVFLGTSGSVRVSGLNATSLDSPVGQVTLGRMVLRGKPPGGVAVLTASSVELLDTHGTPYVEVHPIPGEVRVFPPLGALGLVAFCAIAVLVLERALRGRRTLRSAVLTGLLAAGALLAAGGQRAPGDVDGDGQVTAVDARLVQESLVGLRELEAAELEAADVDRSGAVELADALAIAQVAAGLVPPFPTPQQTGTPAATGTASPSPSASPSPT
jgi:hypothetical protein